MTKLERLRKEIPADLPDDWNCIVRAGDARSLLDAVEALRVIDKADPSPSQIEQWIVWTKSISSPALAALDKEEP